MYNEIFYGDIGGVTDTLSMDGIVEPEYTYTEDLNKYASYVLDNPVIVSAGKY